METVLSLLVVLGGLALVGWLGVWFTPHGALPARVNETGSSPSRRSSAAEIAVALERAEGIGDLGRHDERRCGF